MTLIDELLCSWCENFCAMNHMLSQQLCIRKCNNIVDIRRAYNEMPCWRLNLLYSYHFGIERVVVGHYCLANLCAYFRFTSHILNDYLWGNSVYNSRLYHIIIL